MLRSSILLLLAVTGTASAQTFTAGPGLAFAVPDNTYNGTLGSMGCHTLNVPAFAGNVEEASVQIAMSHTFVGDLTIKLVNPAGSVATLVSRPGVVETVDDGNDTAGFGENSNLAFANPLTYIQSATDESEMMGKVPSDLATGDVICLFAGSPCSYNPDNGAATSSEDLTTAFDGSPGVGNWQLCLGDSASADTGTLDGWSLTLTAGVVANADLSITKTDGTTTVAQGGSTTYTVTASNAGPDAATGATVADTFPADCTAVSWTCVGAGGGTCTAAGAGNINDTVNLPSGASVTYTAACTISGTAASPLVNTATVAAPAGVTDPTPGNNSATDSDTVSADVAPQFAYSPASPGPVNFIGGTTVGSTATGTITVSVGTAGAGSGAAATTTTTCTAPGGFTGFGQSVTAVGAGAISGGPLTGTCTLGAMANTQPMTCIENRGGTPTTVNFDLTCPAGSAVVVDSFPTSGTTVTLPTQNLGGPATTADINFFVNGAGSTTVNCTAPVATEFTVAPLIFPVGPATTTITYSSLVAGTFNGQLDCTAGAQNFTFPLVGITVGGQATAIPVLGEGMRYWLMLAMLGLGIGALGAYSRRN